MRGRVRSFLFYCSGARSLRVRLFCSFALLVCFALVLAATMFVIFQRGERDREALDRLAAAAPSVTLELRGLYERGKNASLVYGYVQQEATARGLRVLLVRWPDGYVVDDSGGTLQHRQVNLPDFTPMAPSSGVRSLFRYRSWNGAAPDAGNLIFLTAITSRSGRPFALDPGTSGSSNYVIAVLAIPRETIATHWLGLLPALAWAGLAALALSAMMAVLLSRSIAGPLVAVTRASEALAKGSFDQEVPTTRQDEIGRLAVAFNAMARELGRSYLQTRALVANVSHDLKTPLTSILGFAQALRDQQVSAPQDVHELAEIIYEEADHVVAIIWDILYLSQLDAGEMVLNRALVRLSDLAARSLRRIEPSLRERGIAVVSQFDPTVHVSGDAAKLERILDNLLDNARKYTPAGGQIVLEVGRAAMDPARAQVQVMNSGAYIPAGEAARVFDRFYRLDRSRSASVRGSGLGLAIVKELVELHAGSICIESDHARGTIFTVTLPASTSLAPLQLGDAAAAEAAASPALLT